MENPEGGAAYACRMRRVRFTRDEQRSSLAPGVPVTLTARSWEVSVATASAAIGAVYRRPVLVEDERDGRTVRVLDHVMLVRVLSAALLTGALLTRRLMR